MSGALIVDSDPFAGSLICSHVEGLGFDACHVLDAQSALTEIRKHSIELAIVDYALQPIPSGPTVIEHLIQYSPMSALLVLSSQRSANLVTPLARKVPGAVFLAKGVFARPTCWTPR